ncbi:MAG: tripartite tricarboxylate transporter substrate binding protein [Comamonadaceae bacterium]|nr:tripartite tricarboxylate transporter substrate binding protein [Comamonadaceae bacterium]
MKTQAPLRLVRTLAAVFSACLFGFSAGAQAAAGDYPQSPVKVIVPYAAGGGTDLVARLITAKLSDKLNQRMIVDNRPGGGGSLGTELVVRSPNDGYTLLFHSGTLAIDPSFKKNLPYDVRKDLIPISLAVSGPFFLVGSPALPAKTTAELIAYARANPKKINFGSPGIGSSVHLAGELFKSMTGIDIVHVPYKGAAPALAGLMANDIQIMFDLISTSKPLAESGKIKLIGVGKIGRSADVPTLPSIDESGLPGYESAVWMGLLAPAGTPRQIVDKLAVSIKAVLEMPDVKAALRVQGLDTVGSTPDEFSKFLARDIERYAKVIRDAKIEAE